MRKWLEKIDWDTVALVIIGIGLWSGLLLGVFTDVYFK